MKPAARHLIAALLLLGAPKLCACVPSGGDPPADTLRIQGRADSTGWKADTLGRTVRAKKSPGLAMLLSAGVPGAGQFYNQSYWKVPVVFGLGLYFVSTWLDQNRRTEDFRQKYAASLLPGAPAKEAFNSDTYLREREFYKEQRDTFAWYFVILYFVNVADAYVDASLFDFDVGGDLSLRLLPGAQGPLNPVPGLTVRIGF
ncbi:MAG TPA: DUF5683 domain-containing protein [Bacteroidota bacterium]|nr:DUF5683 domain-containing protein [Bacteroidota bacterium]